MPWPAYAILRRDGTGEVRLPDGQTYPVDAESVEDLAEQILDRLITEAETRGETGEVIAENQYDSSAARLLVHPDGTVEEGAPPTASERLRRAPDTSDEADTGAAAAAPKRRWPKTTKTTSAATTAKTTTVAGSATAASTPGEPSPARRRRRVVAVAVGGLAAMAVLGGGAVALSGLGEDPDPAAGGDSSPAANSSPIASPSPEQHTETATDKLRRPVRVQVQPIDPTTARAAGRARIRVTTEHTPVRARVVLRTGKKSPLTRTVRLRKATSEVLVRGLEPGRWRWTVTVPAGPTRRGAFVLEAPPAPQPSSPEPTPEYTPPPSPDPTPEYTPPPSPDPTPPPPPPPPPDQPDPEPKPPGDDGPVDPKDTPPPGPQG